MKRIKSLIGIIAIGMFTLHLFLSNPSNSQKFELSSLIKLSNAYGEDSGGDCASYCPSSGSGCIIVYSNGTRVTCTGKWS
jgi:hypothetical protein